MSASPIEFERPAAPASESSRSAPDLVPAPPVRPLVEIVVPVYNEEAALETSVRRLADHLAAHLPFDWRIVIADNASTDDTPAIALGLARELAGVEALVLPEKGRGRALRAAWSASDADVLCYMDVDLSTDLNALLPLVAPLVSGHSDVAIGTRLSRHSHVVRGAKRELISRTYNQLLRYSLGAKFSDAQCGFKAVRADAAAKLLPAVRDEAWFFDTELLVLAQRAGLRIHEVPVDWTDDPDSRVDIVRTALDDLRGICRLLSEARVARFLAVGIVSTVAYALLYLLFRAPLGPGGANALSLAITAVANTQANRRLTFGVSGRASLARDHVKGAFVYVMTLILTSGALEVLNLFQSHPSRSAELVVLVIAGAGATATRYVALRSWVFARRKQPSAAGEAVLYLGRAGF
jgi:glycosyltransferase involved in cell wall biosynthesis